MADGLDRTTINPTSKKKENVRAFIRHRRRYLSKQQKRISSPSSSSNNSHITIPSTSSTNVEELVSFIEQKLNHKQTKSGNNKNIIVVNYKPVFVNSHQQKSSMTTRHSSPPVSKPKIFPTDDDFSSATHYSRRRSLTTTSSDGSSLRSTSNHSKQQQQQRQESLSLDVPDVEDPLMFIEMMYQQLFTEDGQLRSGTEPTVLANCVKQIVTNSRRNSISSSIANGSTSSHLKHKKSNPSPSHQQQRKSSKSTSLSVPTPLITNEQYDTFSEDEEEPATVVQTNTQHQTIKTNIDTFRK